MMRRIFVYEFLSGGGTLAGAGGAGAELLAMGVSMRDAIASDLLARGDYEVSVATCAAAPQAPPGATPRRARDAESAFDFVAREADAHPLVWVTAPETDAVLARLQACVDPARWIGCEARAIGLASGKRATLLRLAEAGICTPLAFEHAADITRWVVKPDDGAGAAHTRLHRSLDAALEDWTLRSRVGVASAVEPWIEGEALSLSLLCGAARCEVLSVNRQRIAIDTNDMLAFEGVDVSALPVSARHATLAARVARAVPGLRGFVGVDLVWHARRGPVVIEINPRATCAIVGLSRALGRNVAGEVVAACDAAVRPQASARPPEVDAAPAAGGRRGAGRGRR